MVAVVRPWSSWEARRQEETIMYTETNQVFVQVQIKENIKAPRHWPLLGETSGDRWISLTKGQ